MILTVCFFQPLYLGVAFQDSSTPLQMIILDIQLFPSQGTSNWFHHRYHLCIISQTRKFIVMCDKHLSIMQSLNTDLIISAEKIKHNFLKRAFDILFSLSALILTSPIFIGLILLIKLTSKGQPIFGHARIGRGGESFVCYKFRTMHADADAKLQELLKNDLAIRAEWETSYKLKNDPRITPIGHFLRKTSLDEFPQFWNVLKGDLSIVGPRPVVKDELSRYFGKKAEIILSIRPGLTGLWQVSGRSNTTYEERILLDEEYVKNQSFLLDLKLIAKTLPALIYSKGAY